MSEEIPNDEQGEDDKKKKNESNDDGQKEEKIFVGLWSSWSEKEQNELEVSALHSSAVSALFKISQDRKTPPATMLYNFSTRFFGSPPTYTSTQEGRFYRCQARIIIGGRSLVVISEFHTTKKKAEADAAQKFLLFLIREIILKNNRGLIPRSPHNF
eukprot:TRINITY_DN1284_c0_g1_i1.p1 TRINITY_DN1284_c0_g1~~TRINITY_DN1284_c0_g1_i1.p1  ORF type:complete len:157 (+),score=42.38 TRINITY_DN1284_c0_g1_i1:33-503(+)